MSDYAIIAGISKAGTTSLYEYLSDHPQIIPSNIKQTFFFLDRNIQEELNLYSLYNYEKGLEQFDLFFKKKDGDFKYRLEATPDYLYSIQTPHRIKQFLNLKQKEGKIIIILRDPTTRFNSFFYYGKQQGLISEHLTYEEFYKLSKKYNENNNPCLMAYKTGFYAKNVDIFNSIFKENLKIIFFEDLKNNPKTVIEDICGFLGITRDYYNNFTFKPKNETVSVKNRRLSKIYGVLRRFYIDKFYKTKLGLMVGNFLKKTISPLYKKINFQKLKKNKEDEKINQLLKKDYSEDIEKLELIIQKSTPWNF